MIHKRRQFIAHSTALLGALTVPRFAISQRVIGNGTLTTVSDGNLVLPKSFLIGDVPTTEADEILDDYGLTGDQFTPPCNVTLYQDAERTILFDAGSGPDFQPSAGQLMDSLDAAGVAPEDVTHVVLTHAHPDHIWGMIDDFDEPTFFNAKHMMGRQEWDYWWNPETVNTIGDERAAFAVGAKRRMEILEDQIEQFDDGQEILAGIQSVLTPGHTPGHMSFEIRHNNDAVLVIGDAIPNEHLAFRRPDWLSGSDQDPERSAETRIKLFDRIVSDKLAIVGFHLPDGGIGRVEKGEDGFLFQAERL